MEMLLSWSDPRIWPGKRARQGDELRYPGQPETHPSAFHMLDVAAAAKALLLAQPGRLARVSSAFAAADSDALLRSLVFLIAVHDLGKFTSPFVEAMMGERPAGMPRFPGTRSHWQASAMLLKQFDDMLAPILGGFPQKREELYLAVAGHHGRPPKREQTGERDVDMPSAESLEPAETFLREMIALIGPGRILTDDQNLRPVRIISHVLSGLTVMADWIGSNRDWFPFTAPDAYTLAAYWAKASEQAAQALRQAGASACPPAAMDNGAEATVLGLPGLRPMQHAVAEVDLPEGPVLALVEDLTGAGKTEAALILAQRMMLAGKASGFYFALPTMATSNALFGRLRDLAQNLFDGSPSLALAHARRRQHAGFRAAIAARSARDTESGAPGCAAWIADDRRKVFLAEIGVGTLDQALQAVLPSRFNTLRLAGLSERVLIVDEAHAYDPYTRKLLTALLKFQAAMGGAAIVMTATLPNAMRKELVQAFREGLARDGADGRRLQRLPVNNPGFPGLAIFTRDHAAYQAVDIVPELVRDVRMARLGNLDALLAEAGQALARGSAAAIIRNAVDEAISTARALDAAGHPVTLFHARFALADRLAIEEKVLARFGRHAAPQDRAGHILVATQVAEQSLDLDFDWMASDLAPIEALIQRMGRLWRHMGPRPAETRTEAAPVLHILSPAPGDQDGPNWLNATLGAGAHVYAPDLLWLTARALFAAGRVAVPGDFPGLLEAVYGPGAEDQLKGLADAALKREGAMYADRAKADFAVLEPSKGYGSYHDLYNDADAERRTRLGEPQITLVLARMGADGALEPWASGADLDDLEGPDVRERRWSLSELSINQARWEERVQPALAARLSAEPGLQAAIDKAVQAWPEWRQRQVNPRPYNGTGTVQPSMALLPVAGDGAIGPGIRYDAIFGLDWTPQPVDVTGQGGAGQSA